MDCPANYIQNYEHPQVGTFASGPSYWDLYHLMLATGTAGDPTYGGYLSVHRPSYPVGSWRNNTNLVAPVTYDPAVGAPIAVPPLAQAADPVFVVVCSWRGCGQPVRATRAEMEGAARAHLKVHHQSDDDLRRVQGVAKHCRCTGCDLKSETVRTHVARTHFASACRQQDGARPI